MELLQIAPGQIGELEVSLGHNREPEVSNSSIVLPAGTQAFYRLKEYQFIATAIDGRQKVNHFFFGIDESPFMSELAPRAVRAFQQMGATGFYESLKPKVINIFTTLVNQPVRQGDIWGIKIADGWEEAETLLRDRVISKEKGRRKKITLFITRHQLHGEGMQAVLITSKKHMRRLQAGIRARNPQTEVVILGQGEVTAPDHKPLNIGDGVYALIRSIGISRAAGVAAD